jgi:hypothetical protein
MARALFYSGPMKVLILGNGLSRLSFDAKIREWDGPIWGCNRIYLDYGDVLTGLAGHADVMQEAKLYRDAHGQKYAILGEDEPFQCAEKYRKDTGTTLVAEALTRGMEVELCGFDLGGPDIYSPDHDKKNKTTWVQRWRAILTAFGPEHVTFWGYDHKRFLLSSKPAIEYFRLYGSGKAHIPTDAYEKELKGWKGDYSRIYALVPTVLLHNKGGREYTIESSIVLKGEESIQLPETLAQKYVDLYPRDLAILPLPE